MKFSHNSGVYRLFNEQFLPISIETAWSFFSDPKNLQLITPKEMDFKITNPVHEKAYPGQIITYSIKLNRFRMNWITEITHVEEEDYFVDEQRFGPYKMWHHVHKFKVVDDGVLMTDIVYFKLPFPLFARIAYKLFVKRNLEQIFTHRELQLNTLIQSNQLK